MQQHAADCTPQKPEPRRENDGHEPSVSLEKATPRFLFATVIAVYFFSGGVFLVFSIPLIVAISMDAAYSGPKEVVLQGIYNFWAPIFKAPNASVLLASLLFISLVVGLIIEPIDRTFSKILLAFSKRLSHDTNGAKYGPSPLKFKNARNHYQYAAYLAWLINQRGACLHWEWELFLYHLRWSLCTNALLFIMFYTKLIWTKATIGELLLFGLLPAFLFSCYGVLRSRALHAVNQHYWAKANAEGPISATAPSPASQRVA